MKAIAFLAFIFAVTFARAAEPDFYLASQECKMLVGSLTEPGKLDTGSGDPPTYACIKSGAQISCAVAFQSGGKSQGDTGQPYTVLADSPPYLIFSATDGKTFISVNTVAHAAVISSRISYPAYLGEKVCAAVFATASELEMLRKHDDK